MEWYYRRGDKRGGPLDHDTFCRMVADGRVPPNALVWRRGFDAFVPASFLEGFRHLTNASAQTPHATVAAPPPPGADPWSPPQSPTSSLESVPVPTRRPDTDPLLPFAGGQLLRIDPHQTVPDRVLRRRAWLRFWARWLDQLFFGTLVAFTFPRLLLASLLDWRTPCVLLVYLLLESVCLSAFSTTPGKLLLGIRVRTDSGHRLTFAQAFRRSLSVFVRGQALGLPFATLFSYVVAWGILTAEGSTTWDTRGHFVVRHSPVSALRAVLTVIGVPALLGCAVHFTAERRPDLVPDLAEVLATNRAANSITALP